MPINAAAATAAAATPNHSPLQVRVFNSSDHVRALSAGEVDVVVGWSGELSCLPACTHACMHACLHACMLHLTPPPLICLCLC